MMLTHVDGFVSLLHGSEGSLHDILRRAHKGNDSTVCSLAGIDVEHADALNTFYSIGNLTDNAHVAPLAEVGDALNKSVVHHHTKNLFYNLTIHFLTRLIIYYCIETGRSEAHHHLRD